MVSARTILPAGVFERAIIFNSRISDLVHSGRLEALFLSKGIQMTNFDGIAAAELERR